jgi:hypothetical protein
VRSEQVASIICSLRVMLRTLQGFVDSAYLGRFLFLDLPVLHRVGFPVVSEWCQSRPRIHAG